MDNKAPLSSSQMRLFQHLDEKLQHMDRELATNPQYVQKVIQVLCLRVVFLVGIPLISSFCRRFYEIITSLISRLQINLVFKSVKKKETFPFVASVHFGWVSLNLVQCNLDHMASQNKVKKITRSQSSIKAKASTLPKARERFAVKLPTLSRCCIWLVDGKTLIFVSIGPLINSHHPLNQSAAKITTCFPAFFRVPGSVLVFPLSSQWLHVIFTFVLFGLCSYSGLVIPEFFSTFFLFRPWEHIVMRM